MANNGITARVFAAINELRGLDCPGCGKHLVSTRGFTALELSLVPVCREAGLSPRTISNAIYMMRDRGEVEHVVNGFYRLTDCGTKRMKERLEGAAV
ncbi:MAG: hypothetical protein KC503_43465 [Myxococcales bacterium]|nr:hypothetical protein [Myxococcales bacterium]